MRSMALWPKQPLLQIGDVRKTRIKVRVLVAMVYHVEVRSAKFIHVERGAETRKEYRREYRDTAERGVAEIFQ